MIPRSFGCPMTTTRKGRGYLATVFKGTDTILRENKSDVKLEIKEGSPKRAYFMEVRTDLSNFGSIIPYDECFISPIVKVLAPAKTYSSSFILTIPHCLGEDDDRTKVKIRIVHESRNPAVVDILNGPKYTYGVPFYKIDSNFFEVHTPHFCKVICTYCQTPTIVYEELSPSFLPSLKHKNAKLLSSGNSTARQKCKAKVSMTWRSDLSSAASFMTSGIS